MTQFSVPVPDHAVEQLSQPDRGPGRCLALLMLDQGHIEARGVGQVVAGGAEDHVTDLGKPFDARVRQHGDQLADELPPVAEGGPGEVLEHFHELRIVVAQRGIFDHRDRAEELERRLPEIKGGLMAVVRSLGVACAAHQLGQWSGETLDERFIDVDVLSHVRRSQHSANLVIIPE